MRESRQSFWVGLFVLVGMAALGALIVMFGQAGFWTRGADAYVVNARFDQATGIRVGTIVTIGGIPVGRVGKVGFVQPGRFEQGVNVQIAFDDLEIELRQGTRAKTTEPGLGEGRPPIVILPGAPDNPVLASRAVIPGEISSAVESLFPKAIVANLDKTATQITETAAALTPVLEDLHEVLRQRDVTAVDQPGGPPGNLSTAMARLDSGLKHFNDVLGDPEVKSQLRESIGNFHGITEDGIVVMADMKEATAEFRATATEAKVMVKDATNAIAHFDHQVQRVGRSATESLEIASRGLTRVDALLEKTARGEGTLGRLFTDERLYESLVLTFRRLAETIEEARLLIKDWQKGKIRVAF